MPPLARFGAFLLICWHYNHCIEYTTIRRALMGVGLLCNLMNGAMQETKNAYPSSSSFLLDMR